MITATQLDIQGLVLAEAPYLDLAEVLFLVSAEAPCRELAEALGLVLAEVPCLVSAEAPCRVLAEERRKGLRLIKSPQNRKSLRACMGQLI
jgi:hypothetical protein